MKTALGVPVIAAVLALVAANVADASYCGAARYGRCRSVCCVDACCEQQCRTVMKTCREIVYEQQPMIFLVNKNALSAVSPSLANASPVVLRPQTYWNVDQLFVKNDGSRSGK